jgi:hypothetical protein
MEGANSTESLNSLAIAYLKKEVGGDASWRRYLNHFDLEEPIPYGIHLAVFIEPYLQFILDGQKTVESRFSANRSAPYQQVGKGDVVLLKRTGGPVMGVGSVFLE